MAVFYNYATLSYNGGTTNSNVVSGEIVEVLSVSKNAVEDEYRAGEVLTYVVNVVNSGGLPFSGLTLTDTLGEYTPEIESYVPLTYLEGSAQYYVNGVRQTDPEAVAGPPLVISGINVPAGGNATVIYQATVNGLAPLSAESSITNTVTVSGGGLTTPISASETVNAAEGALLSITKAVNPTTVTDNDRLTYTFVISNSGNTAAVATDDVVVTDTFSPILENITVTFNGAVWSETDNYTYDEATGVFSTVAGQITVPAATYTRDPVSGNVTVTPGTATLVVSGTI